MSLDEEKEIGAEEAKRIEEQIGLVRDEALAAYVRSIGTRLAAYSPRKDIEYTFNVIDSDEVNAFCTRAPTSTFRGVCSRSSTARTSLPDPDDRSSAVRLELRLQHLDGGFANRALACASLRARGHTRAVTCRGICLAPGMPFAFLVRGRMTRPREAKTEGCAMPERISKLLSLVAVGAIGIAPYAVRAEEEKAPIPPSNEIVVSAGELAQHPASYLGLRVRVRAEIEDVHSPRTFTLDEDKIGASPDVLVLAPAGSFPKEGDVVDVTGTVRRFVRTEIKRDYDWFDLGEEYDVKYTERPVIVAESVLPVSE